MKQIALIALLLSFALCLLLVGCANQSEVPDGSTEVSAMADQTESSSVPPEDNTVTPDGFLQLGDSGKARLPYDGNRSGVIYVTSASQLPDLKEMAGYDDAYFEDHGLVLVTETVKSGSVQVGINSITVKDGVASVELSRQSQGDFSTTDMATWLVWAEVDGNLNCCWEVANPAVSSVDAIS